MNLCQLMIQCGIEIGVDPEKSERCVSEASWNHLPPEVLSEIPPDLLPPLKTQLCLALTNGNFSPEFVDLVAEVVHRYHRRINN